MPSKICNIADFYTKLATFFRSVGQTRLADSLDKVVEFLNRVGNCTVTPPASLSSVKSKVKALAPRANEAVTPADVAAALDLAKALADAVS